MRTKDKPEQHRPESLVHTANELEQMASRLRTAADMLCIEPSISEVGVRYESSLVEGLKQMRTWVNEAVRAASDERLKKAKAAGVRKTGHGSESKKK